MEQIHAIAPAVILLAAGSEFASALLRFAGVPEEKIAEWMRGVRDAHSDVESRAA